MNRASNPARRRVLAQAAACTAPTLLALYALPAGAADDSHTYDQDAVLKAAQEFFGETTEGLAKVIEKVFQEHGRPNAFIRGEEASAAITVGVRYGNGLLQMKGGRSVKVYWSGPSIGLDFGGNASKVFTLVYGLPRTDAIFERFPGVEGSLYYIGGVGVNYQRLGNITLAPIRLGIGFRTGANIGYVHYRRKKSYNPL